jgi:hypothetical protein
MGAKHPRRSRAGQGLSIVPLIFGECDSCGADNRVLHHVMAFGTEAYACSECRYTDPKDEIWEIEEEIETIEADLNRHGKGEHRAKLLANLKAELARVTAKE